MFLFIHLIYDGSYYRYNESNDVGIAILGGFLTDDVRCMNIHFYKKWAIDENQDVTGGNLTSLEKENGYIYLSDLYSEEKVPTKLKMTIKQFIQILDDWETKVCKIRPQEVAIKYENDQFSIETSD